jgi:5-amino-6-(5-phosphoribosylamino)uracil reductase
LRWLLHHGQTEKLVYSPTPRVVDARSRLGSVATVVDGGQRIEMRRLCLDPPFRGRESSAPEI